MADERQKSPGRRQSDHYARYSVYILLAIIALLFVLLGLALKGQADRAHQQNQIADQQIQIRELANRLQRSSLSQCQRSNQSRAQAIRFFLVVAKGNRTVAENWVDTGKVFPIVTPIARAMQQAHLAEARGARSTALIYANAQTDVARDPDAKSLVRRSRVACEGQFGA